MIVRVRMLAFEEPGVIREVDVPDAEITGNPMANLERVFYWGQNDFQPKPVCSVSVGDVAELHDRLFMCRACGWAEITAADLATYEQLEQRERRWSALARP